MAGAAGALSFVNGTFLTFCLPALAPVVVRFTMAGDEIHLLMGVILLMFCALLFFSSRRNVKMVRDVFSLEIENTDLIADLEQVNTDLTNENAQRKKTQIELERHREHLEEIVANRTAALLETNKKLEEEIHRRQQIEEELQQRNQTKSEFISIASHELRTPLTSILGFSQLLIDPKQFKDKDRHEFLEIIHEKAETLESIVTDLLDISRVESGQPFVLHKTNIELYHIIRHEVALFQKISPQHQFHAVFAEETLVLQVDEGKIVQVLENLLSNAVKYSPHGGTIVINAQRQGADCLISVSDDGLGMNQDQVDKVFDKFYRANLPDSVASGLGLGMSIVMHIVEIHGGRIWVQSEPNRGTTVTFTIPLEGTQTVALGTGSGPEDSSALNREEQ